MEQGVAVIHEAYLQHDDLNGKADFLVRVEQPSALGDWSYEVVECKLAGSARAEFLIQGCT